MIGFIKSALVPCHSPVIDLLWRVLLPRVTLINYISVERLTGCPFLRETERTARERRRRRWRDGNGADSQTNALALEGRNKGRKKARKKKESKGGKPTSWHSQQECHFYCWSLWQECLSQYIHLIHHGRRVYIMTTLHNSPFSKSHFAIFYVPPLCSRLKWNFNGDWDEDSLRVSEWLFCTG